MDTNSLLDQLGYTDSPFFLQGERLFEHPGYSHVFRKAQDAKSCSLVGVYTLRQTGAERGETGTIIPTVYVCKAEDEAKAREIHRLVWNQNTVPFLVVTSPKMFRVYRGFEYKSGGRQARKDQHILEVARDANTVLDILQDFHARSIDSGRLWVKRGRDISVSSRVDRKLLNSLKRLSDRLVGGDERLERNVGHVLIGKYVYLCYLRDRGILSDERFEKAGIDPTTVLGRNPNVSALYALEEYLDDWLNGSVFRLPKTGIKKKHVEEVARAFLGDDPSTGQMYLDFAAYDFSHIPIETLSVVYQQFLHAEGDGRGKGAYYTPSWLVNMVLDELEVEKPLQEGMKVFDPSCGSGAFLVQCYRRLIERELAKSENQKLSPIRLRELLTKYIYGLEVDEDACNVSELSLILTLLDYVKPADLTNTTFKLPELRDKNIFFCTGGFFDSESEWATSKRRTPYDWVVGNPPWKQLHKQKLKTDSDSLALKWIDKNRNEHPVDNFQIAEAFAWKVPEVVSEDGAVGLLMPASVLFNKQARRFRAKFFSEMNVKSVANLANMRHHIFEGAISPCAVFVYSRREKRDRTGERHVLTYAPFVVEQLNRYGNSGNKEPMWTMVISESMVCEVRASDILSGESLPWKLAMWGTVRDRHLLERIIRRFVPLSVIVGREQLSVSQGVELRRQKRGEQVNFKVVDAVPEVVGKNKLIMSRLKDARGVYQFSRDVFGKVEKTEGYVRKGRSVVTLKICKPPHVIVDAARRFSVYSEEYVVVPPRQIGISGDKTQSSLLKAIAAYLNSDFVLYHQYLTSGLWGVERDRPNLDDLKRLPVPFEHLSSGEVSELGALYDKLVEASESARQKGPGPLFAKGRVKEDRLETVLKKLNSTVYEMLGIRASEQVLIDDLLKVRMKLNEGNIAKEAVEPAVESEMLKYAKLLKGELDEFLGVSNRHNVSVYYSEEAAIVKIQHLRKSVAGIPAIEPVSEQTENEFGKMQSKLGKQNAQWIYFNKGLRILEGRTTYLYKPRERLYWLKSQALVDADEFIAEKLGPVGGTD